MTERRELLVVFECQGSREGVFFTRGCPNDFVDGGTIFVSDGQGRVDIPTTRMLREHHSETGVGENNHGCTDFIVIDNEGHKIGHTHANSYEARLFLNDKYE